MSNAEQNATPEPTNGPAEEAPQAPQEETTDWKAEARKWEARAKSNKDAATRLAALEEANKTEEQKRAEKLASLEKELSAYKKRDEIAAWSAEIVKDSTIPASVLRGETREELEQHFAELESLITPRKEQPRPTAFPGFEAEPKPDSATSGWLGQLFGGN